MAYLEWTDNLSVGVPLLDEDHRKLIGLINRVYQSVADGDGEQVVKAVLDELIDYTNYHFRREERMMEAAGYPDTDDHRGVHAELSDQVVDFRRRYLADPSGFKPMTVFDFLSEWLMKHIIGRDLKYRPYLEGKA